MFQQLHALVKSVEKLTITMMAGDDGMMRVFVTPSVSIKTPMLAQPLALVATPQELDEGFIAAVSQYQAARMSLADQVAATTVIIEAAKKEQAAIAVKSLKKPVVGKASKTADDSELVADHDEEAEGLDDESQQDSPVEPKVKIVPAVNAGTDLSSLI